ncbi:6-phosphogluconolactonase [Cellulomonas fimi]|uniref:6-phosphogluconolactonase n=1 Tax=Cellulomonas fimi (strain ATCC 484 / DSM 20113 / JCM 1341 / CCUG 24087 / LMG 16345 / NBRC 15513 / NCIMB 8980 / NCTC 7547 / NRS-133) TaxID=590998 RepID=F4GZ09_CELFA|nr:6-phosphogluconolactonase [Cellulomonas fimi]AEE45999.1 6-phosphogluconolactonase [Cellulomonas fimi ATCC 484]NNH06585.1 6-phosphogluconolactonase [Cellulomonas fimi]VEH31239.1 6-phosphogluconolactonase [Cellulomonas fimi]
MSRRDVVVHPDATVLADAVAARLLTRLLDLQSHRSPVHVVLTGGTVGIASLAAVARSPLRDAVDWTGVHLWWGDERFLPDGHAARNETQAREALLDGLDALPAANVHPIPALSQDVPTPEAAAAAYARTLASFAPPGLLAPRFDVALFGMGPDGHVASLFPGHDTVHVTGVATVAVHDSPKPPPLRVSLTFDVVRASREVWVVAAGAEKAAAVASALSGAPVAETPAAGALGTERTLWLVDAAATTEAAPGAAGDAPTSVEGAGAVEGWSAVDAWFEQLAPQDVALVDAARSAREADLPDIAVSPLQGKFLHLLAQAVGARRVLELGTLGGYSTLWLARALPPDGTVATLEVSPEHARVARETFVRAGVDDQVEVLVGPAAQTLDRLAADGIEPFDLVFVDADKQTLAQYLDQVAGLVRPGALVVVDNVVRGGAVVDAQHPDDRVQGVRRFVERVVEDPRWDATALQTVGSKGYDGFALVRRTTA